VVRISPYRQFSEQGIRCLNRGSPAICRRGRRTRRAGAAAANDLQKLEPVWRPKDSAEQFLPGQQQSITILVNAKETIVRLGVRPRSPRRLLSSRCAKRNTVGRRSQGDTVTSEIDDRKLRFAAVWPKMPGGGRTLQSTCEL
jgi:hypothetical protein